MIKGIIFDLDGTLLNTSGNILEALNTILTKYNYQPYTLAECMTMVGWGFYRLIELATTKQQETSDEKINTMVLELMNYYDIHPVSNTITVYEGVPELLSKLAQHNIPIAILTNKGHDAAQKVVTHFFGAYPFIHIQGVEHDGIRKPEREFVEKLLPYFHPTTVHNLALIGDSEIDIQTAHIIGMQSIAVTWGFRDLALLQQADAQYIVHDTHELQEVLLT